MRVRPVAATAEHLEEIALLRLDGMGKDDLGRSARRLMEESATVLKRLAFAAEDLQHLADVRKIEFHGDRTSQSNRG